MSGYRLSWVLAQAGLASRHRAERWVVEGRVRVNGQVVRDPAARCLPDRDRVEVDGRPLPWPPRRVYIALHKPRGVVTTLADPHASDTVAELVRDVGVVVHPVGRLDADSRGLLLLTNDGPLTYRLTHPRYHVPKVYHVLVARTPSPAVLEDLRRGIPLADGPSRFDAVRVLRTEADGTWLEVTLREGRNRQIRRTFATVGHPVLDLVRVAFGPIRLGRLEPGRWRLLRDDEVQALRRAAGLARGGRGDGERGARRPAGGGAPPAGRG